MCHFSNFLTYPISRVKNYFGTSVQTLQTLTFFAEGLEKSNPITPRNPENFSKWRTKTKGFFVCVKCEIDKEMAEKFYSAALCVLAAVLIRWCVSISSYSGKFLRKMIEFLTRVLAVVSNVRQILLDQMVVILLQEKGSHRCLEIMKHRGTGWRLRTICRLMSGNKLFKSASD